MLVKSYGIKGVVHCHWSAPMPGGGLEIFTEISNKYRNFGPPYKPQTVQ